MASPGRARALIVRHVRSKTRQAPVQQGARRERTGGVLGRYGEDLFRAQRCGAVRFTCCSRMLAKNAGSSPEAITRKTRIDAALRTAGWQIVPHLPGTPFHAYHRCAVTEFPTANSPAAPSSHQRSTHQAPHRVSDQKRVARRFTRLDPPAQTHAPRQRCHPLSGPPKQLWRPRPSAAPARTTPFSFPTPLVGRF